MKIKKWPEVELKKLLQEKHDRAGGEIFPVWSVSNQKGFVSPEYIFNKTIASSDTKNYKKVLPSDFAYNPSRINVGSLAYNGSLATGIVSPMYVVFFVKDLAVLEPKYLFNFLKSKRTISVIKNSTEGGVRFQLKYSRLEKLRIPLPPLPIQRQIVSSLDAANELKKKREEADKKMAEFAPALFYQMFGDPGRNEKGWEVRKLGEVTLPVKSSTPSKIFEGNITYIDITAIDNVNGRIRSPKILAVKDAPSRARQVIDFGDVLVSSVRPNLKGTALVSQQYSNAVCSTGFCVLRPDSSMVVSDYLYVLTRQDWFSESLLSQVRGITYPAVTDKQIKNLEIQVPSLNLQRQFASRVAETRKMQERQEESKKMLEEVFEGVMSELI